LDKGPVSHEEQTANWTAVKDGHLPHTDALTRNGVDDPDAALLEINSQPAAILQREKLIAEVVAAWTTAGTSLEAAVKRMKRLFPNMTPEEVTELLSGAKEEDVVEPVPGGGGDAE
jgi:hypothetical protein